MFHFELLNQNQQKFYIENFHFATKFIQRLPYLYQINTISFVQEFEEKKRTGKSLFINTQEAHPFSLRDEFPPAPPLKMHISFIFLADLEGNFFNISQSIIKKNTTDKQDKIYEICVSHYEKDDNLTTVLLHTLRLSCKDTQPAESIQMIDESKIQKFGNKHYEFLTFKKIIIEKNKLDAQLINCRQKQLKKI